MPPCFARLALSFALFSIVAPSLAGAVTPNGRLQIIHLNVGQGDGTVLITPFGQVVLIDNGVYNNTAAPVSQLAALGVTDVDLHFASHYHADHIGAISQIVGSGVTIDAGWDRGGSYNTATYTTYVNTLGAKRHTLVKNQIFTLDMPAAHPVVIKVVDLDGGGQSVTDENAKTVVLKVSYGEFDEVFGGDLTGPGSSGGDIESIVGPEVGPVEVYKVHHHGSRYSSGNNWLNATTPKIGVIQVGSGNSYGHPTADALGRMHAKGVRTYWTQTGAGAAPNPAWDKVANGQVIIQATWEGAGVDTIRGPGFADTFTNSGTAPDLIAPSVTVLSPIGGEVWDAGSTHTIRWNAADNVAVDSVNVDYSVHGLAGPWLLVQHAVAGADSVSWLLPPDGSDSAMVRVTAFDRALNTGSDASDALFRVRSIGPADIVPGLVDGLALARPLPNPSLGNVSLGFTLPAPGDARLEIVDIAGRRSWSWDGVGLGAGTHVARWDGHTLSGSRAAVGVYWVRLTAASGTRIAKLVRLQ